MVPCGFFQNPYCYFTLFYPSVAFLPSPFLVRAPMVFPSPTSDPFYPVVLLCCYPTPTPALVHFYLPGFCGYSMLYTHTWGIGARNLGPRMREIIWCLSFQRWVTSLRTIFSSSIHLPASFMILFFFTTDFQSVYGSHFHCLSISWKILMLFPFPKCWHGAAMNRLIKISVE